MYDKLTPADPSDLADGIAFVLRFSRKKRYHEGGKLMADLTADYMVRHLDLAGYVIMKKPPALGGGDNLGNEASRDSVGSYESDLCKPW
jgi:hypothetical protein